MRIRSSFIAILFGAALRAGTADAAVDIQVDLSSQTMQVRGSDGETYVWPVSTARQGFSTPRGTYGVQSLQAVHFSRKYNNSPMPHSIFFRGGYAIHGTYEIGALGRAASHGCIRLAPRNAALLYRMVQAEGARITINGGGSDAAEVAEAEPPRRFRVRRRGIMVEPVEAYPLGSEPFDHTYEDWMRGQAPLE